MEEKIWWIDSLLATIFGQNYDWWTNSLADAMEYLINTMFIWSAEYLINTMFGRQYA
jgi:hypothetical protein